MVRLINSQKYVVLDVETNGLSSLKDDLLSISIFKPDDEKAYDRYLPLELNDCVETTWINGITEEMLEDKEPLSQEEFDSIIKEFELDKRIVLTYGNIDERFMKNYLKRKKINGYKRIKFYNFKHDIISSPFSEGNITKDNLCKIYGIDNVTKIHRGINDCILEWKLFEKMNGNKLIIINNSVNEFNNDYIIPASYLQKYHNFKYCINNFPKINYKMVPIKVFNIQSKKLKKFETNISGLTIEHLINSMLDVKNMDKETMAFLMENRRKLKKIGVLPSNIYQIGAVFNKDGTITAVKKKDQKIVKEINDVTLALKKEITPLITYIKEEIFNNKQIMSQELVINKEDNIMAKCDLSNEDAILEIKTYCNDINSFKYQLYYEAKGRKIYILLTDWLLNCNKGLCFTIYRVEPIASDYNLEKEDKETISNTIEKNDTLLFHNMKIKGKESPRIQLSKYQYMIAIKTNCTIQIIKYRGPRDMVSAKCLMCGNQWIARADELLEKCYCPLCKYNKK